MPKAKHVYQHSFFCTANITNIPIYLSVNTDDWYYIHKLLDLPDVDLLECAIEMYAKVLKKDPYPSKTSVL